MHVLACLDLCLYARANAHEFVSFDQIIETAILMRKVWVITVILPWYLGQWRYPDEARRGNCVIDLQWEVFRLRISNTVISLYLNCLYMTLIYQWFFLIFYQSLFAHINSLLIIFIFWLVQGPVRIRFYWLVDLLLVFKGHRFVLKLFMRIRGRILVVWRPITNQFIVLIARDVVILGLIFITVGIAAV